MLYFTRGTGFLSLPASPLRAFVRTRDGLQSPDAYIMMQPFLVTPDLKIAKGAGISMIAHQLRPDSKGSIHIASRSADVHPTIKFNFLSESTDRDCVIAAVKIARQIVAAPEMAWLGPREFLPGPDVQSDDEVLDFVTNTAETTYHPVGTCKMGQDPMAVVDDQLRVRGLDGLRVADASIMPTLTSGNTNAPSIMIGEKAAKMILAAAA
jgi:choline dehydrogenase